MKKNVSILSFGLKNRDGSVLSSGTVTAYDAGTTSLRTLYSDYDLSTEASNPLTLDDSGKAQVYTDKRIKLLIKDSDGRFVRVIDDIGVADTDLNYEVDESIAGDGLVAATNGTLAVSVDGVTVTILNNDLTIPNEALGSDQFADGEISRDLLEEPTTTLAPVGSGYYLGAIDSAQYSAASSNNEIVFSSFPYEISLECSGRPVLVALIPHDPTDPGYIGLQRNARFNSGYVFVERTDSSGTVDIFKQQFYNEFNSLISGITFKYPPGVIRTVDTPAAGSVTYRLGLIAYGETDAYVILNKVRLVAVEL